MFSSKSPLQKSKEFKKVLSKYRPNPQTISALEDSPLVLLVAPAAAGRNTIIRNLIMTGRYHFVVSDTTRPPRMNNGVLERNGTEYWFRTEDEFLDELKRGHYLGTALIHDQQVSGVSVAEFNNATARNKIPITDIEIQGCDEIVMYKPDTHAIFVLPPDFDEWMRRMDGRGAMDASEKRRRLESAVAEITEALSRRYFEYIINWDLRSACQRLHELVTQNRFINPNEQSQAEFHARQLLDDIDSWLKEN